MASDLRVPTTGKPTRTAATFPQKKFVLPQAADGTLIEIIPFADGTDGIYVKPLKGTSKYPSTNPIIVELHGMGHSSHNFLPLSNALAKDQGLESIAVSLPGHYGDTTTWPLREYTRLGYKKYAYNFIGKLAKIHELYPDRPIIIAAHSMGGIITMLSLTLMTFISMSETIEDKDIKKTISETLKSIKGFVPISSIGTSDSRLRWQLAIVFALVSEFIDTILGRPIRFHPWLANYAFYNGALTQDQLNNFMEHYQGEAWKATLQIILSSFGSNLPFAYCPLISFKDIPVLHITGEKDRLVSTKTSDDIDANLKKLGLDVERREIEGGCHNIIDLNAQEVAEYIGGWTTRILRTISN